MPAGEHMAVQHFIMPFMAFQRYDDRGRGVGGRNREREGGGWGGWEAWGAGIQPGSNGDSAVREYLLMSTMLQGEEEEEVWRGVAGGGHWMWDELRDGILALKRGWTLSTRVDLNAWHASAPTTAVVWHMSIGGGNPFAFNALLQTTDKNRAEENYLILSPCFPFLSFRFSCIFFVCHIEL